MAPPVKSVKGKKRSLPKFDGATFEIEVFALTMVPNGSWKLTLMIPPESASEVLKLRTTSGLLLEAAVTTVEGVIE